MIHLDVCFLLLCRQSLVTVIFESNGFSCNSSEPAEEARKPQLCPAVFTFPSRGGWWLPAHFSMAQSCAACSMRLTGYLVAQCSACALACVGILNLSVLYRKRVDGKLEGPTKAQGQGAPSPVLGWQPPPTMTKVEVQNGHDYEWFVNRKVLRFAQDGTSKTRSVWWTYSR